MIYLLLADGFEEVEALTVVDILRRAKIDVQTVSVSNSNLVAGAHNISVQADITMNMVQKSEMEMVILPGGMPGTDNLEKSQEVIDLITYVNDSGKYIAAICAAPKILGKMNLLNGKSAICFPGYECELIGATISEKSVVVDGNIITSKAAGTAADFAFTLVEILCDKQTASNISKKMCYKD